MTYIVNENCIKCKYTDCVEVCPVDCFYADATMLYVSPDECIDCGACEAACPVEAIYSSDDLPDDQEKWELINAEKCESGTVENITEKQEPLPTAEDRKTELGF